MKILLTPETLASCILELSFSLYEESMESCEVTLFHFQILESETFGVQNQRLNSQVPTEEMGIREVWHGIFKL